MIALGQTEARRGRGWRTHKKDLAHFISYDQRLNEISPIYSHALGAGGRRKSGLMSPQPNVNASPGGTRKFDDGGYVTL
ncbi:hypothetical protein FRUB_05345 [Fimbriiglobus ruber]|uniref:Uncharacterized protein n=1 Tax=Fimbriiglobus ruber TaxID=1908690 RepID=A0A225DS49_9BACT|nr:hypothetical protein FRUB_05345 [Fimbriiglobus ruber]